MIGLGKACVKCTHTAHTHTHTHKLLQNINMLENSSLCSGLNLLVHHENGG